MIINNNVSISPTNNSLKDYKFFCFNGKVEYFKIDFDRFLNHRANYYDRNGRIQSFGEVECPPDFTREIVIPDNIKEMENLAEKLATISPFVRVDFYNINGTIYFGEITFFPANGFGNFIPNEYNRILGDKLTLDNT